QMKPQPRDVAALVARPRLVDADELHRRHRHGIGDRAVVEHDAHEPRIAVDGLDADDAAAGVAAFPRRSGFAPLTGRSGSTGPARRSGFTSSTGLAGLALLAPRRDDRPVGTVGPLAGVAQRAKGDAVMRDLVALEIGARLPGSAVQRDRQHKVEI